MAITTKENSNRVNPSGFRSHPKQIILVRIIIIIIIITPFILLQACSNKGNSTIGQNPKPKPQVYVQPAQKIRMVSSVEITGTVQANVFTDVNSPADGIIEILHVRENQIAREGSIIAVVNPEDRLALIAHNQLKIDQLKKAVREGEKDPETIRELTGELENAEKDLEYARSMYQTIPVICPMTGLVTQRWADQGSQVSAKEKIITITDMSSLVIKAEVNEKYYEAIRKGGQLPVFLNAYPDDSLTGKISLVYPQILPETRSIQFDIRIINFNKSLLPGMMASIKIPVYVKENAISVPAHAVLTSPDNKDFLFVVDSDSTARQRIISKGINQGTQLEILEGLMEDEKVVVSGQEMLKDGMKVNILAGTKGGKK
ncbi:MAG: efflux RND transporter periplasmic adaptor subunit [Bacteroidales bacterium]|nr:efflux RND transporter periplasmic adaptor subunit [Bacteroidales bacterium]